MRLDKELVLRGYFETRSKAVQAILDGIIYCDGKKISKPSYKINDEMIELRGIPLNYVSRAGLKLEKAASFFEIAFDNKVMVDVGSSTGGFVDYAIQNGIKKVYAIDVGRDQLSDKLRSNEKIELFEQTDIREIESDKIFNAELVTVDVSFISVTKFSNVITNLPNVSEIVCLIKPQFECGKEIADRFKGIILDRETHEKVIEKLISNFLEYDFNCQGVIYSPIKGGSGNIEYLAYFKKKPLVNEINIKEVVDSAFAVL